MFIYVYKLKKKNKIHIRKKYRYKNKRYINKKYIKYFNGYIRNKYKRDIEDILLEEKKEIVAEKMREIVAYKTNQHRNRRREKGSNSCFRSLHNII